MKNWKVNKNNIGSIAFILGLFVMLMLNLNTYSLYLKMERYNYILAAVILTVAFVCYSDIKTLMKDKFFWLVVLIDFIAVVLTFISGTGLFSILPVYSLTLILYLCNRISFSKKNFALMVAFCAFFFIYWTLDVKGYYKGYSINFGGMVLLYGFIFLIAFIEYLKYLVLYKSEKLLFLKKYPYYIDIVEALLFLWAYKSMSFYRSRTAVVALIVFGVFLCIPRKILLKKWFTTAVLTLVGAGIFAFPIIYIKACNLGILSDIDVFYKSLVTTRGEVWSYLINLIRLKPFSGNGFIVVPGGTVFREGLLDCCNFGIQLLTVYGVVITVAVLILFFLSIYKLLYEVKSFTALRMMVAGIASILVSAYAENSILAAPFIIMFAAFLFTGNSVKKYAVEAEITEDAYSKSALCTKEFKGKFVPVLLVSVLLLFMYIILGPLEIFYSNYNEFMYNTSDFIWFFLILLCGTSLVIALILAPMPKIVSLIYSTIGLSIALVSYIQYMFINSDLVDDNGNFAASLDLGSRYYISAAVAIIVPIILVALIYVLKDVRERIIVYSSLFVTAIMITAVATIAVNLLMLQNKGKYINVLSGESEYELATDENIVVILLDTFGREALDEELKEDPDYLNVLSDFTFYEKADSVYAPTYPSLVHLLTEYEYEREDRIYMEPKAFQSDSSKEFFGILHDNGYRVELHTRDLIMNDYMYDVADNAVPCKITVNKKDVRKSLFKMSVYRYMPYNLKPYFEVYNPKAMNVACDVHESYAENYEFYQGMMDKGVVVNPEISKKFTLCHLEGGLHLPYINDENLNQVPVNSVSKHQVLQGIKKLLSEYFDALKELGVYDNATIIVMADHGERGNTDAIFFKKDALESHDAIFVNSEPFTYHEFIRVVIDSVN